MVDYRISGAGSYRNPFLEAFQRQQVNPFQVPRIGQNQEQDQGTGGFGGSSPGTNYSPYLNRSNYDQQLQQRRRQQEQQQPEALQRMMEMLKLRELELARLRQQLESTQDPATKQFLQSMMQSSSSGYSSLQGQYNQQFRGIGSGFVGSENRIDHIGSFVTLV